MKQAIKILTAAATLASLGCGKLQNANQFVEDAGNGSLGEPEVVFSRPQCEVEYYDFKIDTSVVAFEFQSQNGGSFGFNLGSGFLKSIGMSMDLKSSKLSMVMDVSRPLIHLSTIEGGTDSKETQISGNIGFSDIGLGFDHYSKTPLATMTRQGLVNNLKNVSKDLDARAKAGTLGNWSTRVLQTPEKFPTKVVIQAGSEAGLKPGDELNVFHVQHYWEGQPCASRYLGMEKLSKDPIATLVVTDSVWSSPSNAIVDLQDPQLTNKVIQQGDYVEVKHLAGDTPKTPRKALARSVKVGTITSGKLMLDDKTEVDLPSYMRQQIVPVITDPTFAGRFVVYPK